jgi:hypothetical protein
MFQQNGISPVATDGDNEGADSIVKIIPAVSQSEVLLRIGQPKLII